MHGAGTAARYAIAATAGAAVAQSYAATAACRTSAPSCALHQLRRPNGQQLCRKALCCCWLQAVLGPSSLHSAEGAMKLWDCAGSVVIPHSCISLCAAAAAAAGHARVRWCVCLSVTAVQGPQGGYCSACALPDWIAALTSIAGHLMCCVV